MSRQPVSVGPQARVAIFSPRGFHHHVCNSHGYEFEDVIVDDLDVVDLFAPGRGRFHSVLNKTKNALSYQTEWAGGFPIGLETMHCARSYDLFFFTMAHPRNLNLLSALKGWRARSKTAICWVQELWVHELPRLGPLLDRLNEFDHVICSFAHAAEALAKQLTVPVHYIPWGLDAVHFCPSPNPPNRVIDILNIGAHHDNTHRALVEYADRTGQFYSYETIAGRAEMHDHRGHRHNYVGQLQRCRYFFSYIAKVHLGDRRHGQVEFGLRYIEGLAAGAVVLGTRIDSAVFEEHLGWADSVIEVPYDCPGIGEIIEGLDSEPDRLAAIRKRNVLECLKRHDHLHRWEKLLKLAAMEPHPKMAARRETLNGLTRTLEEGENTVGPVRRRSVGNHH